MIRTLIAAVTLCIAILPGTASAKPSLRDVPKVENTLFMMALAREVHKYCDEIGERYLKGKKIALGLYFAAKKLGYSDAEIRAYVESDVEKARLRAKGEQYLKANGVDYGSPETFCVFGHAEIEKSSAIGALLRAN